MRRLVQAEVHEIVRRHGDWLRGVGGKRACFDNMDLSGLCLQQADLSQASLRRANLSHTDLRDVNLYRTDMTGATLRGAILRGANLAHAHMTGVDVVGADFRDADLQGAYCADTSLLQANLLGANITLLHTKESLCRLDFGGWSVFVTPTVTTIGCQSHPNSLWLGWSHTSMDIREMHADAADWWKIHGGAIKAVIRCVMQKAGKSIPQLSQAPPAKSRVEKAATAKKASPVKKRRPVKKAAPVKKRRRVKS